jgi:hypothetical protein
VTVWADFTPTADATREADDNQMSFEEEASKSRGNEDEDEHEESDMPHQTEDRAKAVKAN